jgi:hypothetical protein
MSLRVEKVIGRGCMGSLLYTRRINALGSTRSKARGKIFDNALTYFSKNMKSLAIGSLLVIITLLTGCAAGMIHTTYRVPSELQSTQFNSLASQYMVRPTFVSADTMKDGSRVLSVMIDSYGTHQPSVPFYERDKIKYIEAIDKYLEWEAKALNNKDILEKEILRVRNPNTLIIQLNFHSGNEYNHYLSVGFVSKGLLGETAVPILTFDRKNALELRRLFQSMSSFESTADRYN